MLGEAGLFDLDVHAIPARNEIPTHEHFDLRFLLVADSLATRAGSDALSTRWVSLEQVDTVQSDTSVMRAVRKLQRATLGL